MKDMNIEEQRLKKANNMANRQTVPDYTICLPFHYQFIALEVPSTMEYSTCTVEYQYSNTWTP